MRTPPYIPSTWWRCSPVVDECGGVRHPARGFGISERVALWAIAAAWCLLMQRPCNPASTLCGYSNCMTASMGVERARTCLNMCTRHATAGVGTRFVAVVWALHNGRGSLLLYLTGSHYAYLRCM